MSIYQKRWSSCGTGTTPATTTTTTTNRSMIPKSNGLITNAIEPSTIGTSWNSVRWNKPSTSYRANLASKFENNSAATNSISTYSPSRSTRFLSTTSAAAKNAADLASVGPSVSARASRFDSTNFANKDKYRSEARELINKWSSRERTSIGNTFRSPVSRSAFRSSDSLLSTNSGNNLSATPKAYSNTAYRTSTSLTPTRINITATSPTPSRYSTMERLSVTSPSPTPLLHTTPKADRPWRQRMAESSRIRSTLGDDVSEGYSTRRAAHASSRRNSLSQDEAAAGLSSYETAASFPSRVSSYSSIVPTASYRSRQNSTDGSSVFTPSSRFTTSSTPNYVPYSLRNTIEETNRILSKYADRSLSRSKSPTRENLPISNRSTSQIPKNASIRESSKERDSERKRKKSVKERTVRRNSRQNSQQESSSSSDEEIHRAMRSRSTSAARLRKLRKKSQNEGEKIEKPSKDSSIMNKSMTSSLYETGAEEALIHSLSSQITASLAESIQALSMAAENDGFHSCAASPLAPSISRSSSKNGVVKSQVIKSPSLVEVLGLPKSESKTSFKTNNGKAEFLDDDEITFDFSIDEQPSECSSRIDDESQYSAVVHFKPTTKRIKRSAPVPGLWKTGADNQEFISRNKRFVKQDDSDECEIVLRQIPIQKVANKFKKKMNFAQKSIKSTILPEKIEKKCGEKMEKDESSSGKNNFAPLKIEDLKQMEEEAKKLQKQKEEEAKKLQKQKEEEAKKLQKQKEEEAKKLQKQKEEEAEKVRKQKEEVAKKLQKQKEEEARKLQKQKEEEAKKLQKQKEEEAEKVRKQKEEEAKKLQKQKEEEAKKLQKQKEEEAKKLQKQKEEEAKKLQKQKEEEAEKVRKQKEEEAKKLQKQKEEEAKKLQKQKEEEAEKARKQKEEEAKKLQKQKEEEAKKLQKQKEEEAKKLQKQKEEEAKKLQKQKEEEAKKLQKQKEEEAIKIQKQKEEEAKKLQKQKEEEAKKLQKQKEEKNSESKKSENLELKKVEAEKQKKEAKSEISTNNFEKKKMILTKTKKKSIVSAAEMIDENKIEITKQFSNKFDSHQKCEKRLQISRNHKINFKCGSAGNQSIKISEHFRRKSFGERATVLVDTPIEDFNHCLVNFRAAESRDKTNDRQQSALSLTNSRSVSRTSETRASVILDEMRGVEASVEWTRDDGLIDFPNDLLILPDQSILETYVNRRRGKQHHRAHHRPSSMCSARGYESSDCASPCPSTVSELCLPSTNRRQNDGGEDQRKRATTDAVDVQLNSIPQGFSRIQPAPPVVKPVPFEAPKTLFEKMIQEQATKNRQNLLQQTNSDSETRDPSPRRGSEEAMSSISQQFAAAAASNNGHSQVRYAAHLPVNRSTSDSGRISVSSVDSQKSSGALDAASKNIDQVIDQARHRHHQHRNKFKEAIDYLDQIFEDLKKECDPDDKNNNENQIGLAQKPTKPTTTTTNRKLSEEAKKESELKPKSSISIAKKPIVLKPKTAASVSNSVEKKQQIKQTAQSPVEVVIPVRKLLSADEPNVAETIVLAKKTDKMDFTRRWLQDDLSSLAHLPPANIAPNVSYYQDFDEHSLGSCSAEVAAFNTAKEKKSSKPSRKHSDSLDPVRPRPFRPQPIYPMTDLNHGSVIEAFGSNTLPRVTSTDEMRRSGSQDPYNTLRSMRSEGGDGYDRPSPSAFQQVSGFSRGGSMRSSLRSLPDHSPVRQKPVSQRYDEKPDPILSIDQLVAELELNTDQPTSAVEKRRSFPTSFVRQNPQQIHHHQTSNEYEKPNRYRAELKQAPTRGRIQGYGSSTDQKLSAIRAGRGDEIQRQQKSLDEVTNMLNKVVSQFGTSTNQHQHHAPVYKQINQSIINQNHGNNAFETINQEKINPSRVEAMHNMFEKGTTSTSWKMNQPQQNFNKQIVRDQESIDKKTSPVHETQYASLNNYSPSNNNPNSSIMTGRNLSQSHFDYIPQIPTSQPPQRPPGSANSSTGGYYSSNSSGVGSNHQSQHHQYNNPNARRSFIDQQSISSRVPSVDDDDDGFYDNVGIFDDRRFSRGSDLEAGASFRNLPPSSSGSSHKQNRIGSFLRKISAAGNRPPGSAASLMSLNKISNETVMKPVGLMKSNSLSTEPWKKQVLQSNSSMPREASSNHKTGLGARLKNSLFGSKKRLDG